MTAPCSGGDQGHGKAADEQIPIHPVTKRRVERMNEVRKRRGVMSPIRIAWMGTRRTDHQHAARPICRDAISRVAGSRSIPVPNGSDYLPVSAMYAVPGNARMLKVSTVGI
jgi:hypothetical protein